KKPRPNARSANRSRLPASSSRKEGLSTKSRMVTTKEVAKATHSARSTDSRDRMVNRMNGAKPATKFMDASYRKKPDRDSPAPRFRSCRQLAAAVEGLAFTLA